MLRSLPLGAQYRALRYAQTLAEAEAVASVGSRGDSYDAMAEALNSLHKHELIHLDSPWTGRDDVEAATADRVHWFNTERLHSMLDYRAPGEEDRPQRGLGLSCRLECQLRPRPPLYIWRISGGSPDEVIGVIPAGRPATALLRADRVAVKVPFRASQRSDASVD